MDMKHILQVLDKSSSRRVEGANDMRRFVSAVRKLNNLSEQSAEPTDPGYQRFAELMAKYNMLQREVGGTDNLIKVATSVSPDAKAEIDSMRAKAVQIAGPNLQAWDKAYADANAGLSSTERSELAKKYLETATPQEEESFVSENIFRKYIDIVEENNTLKSVADKITAAGSAVRDKLDDFRPYDEKAVAKMYGVKAKEKKEDYDLDEAGKPGDPGFKPNLQVPQAPPFPEGDFAQPGPYDLGNGEKLTVNQDGTRVHAGGFGRFTYDKAGKPIKYVTPQFTGLSQEHDLVTGNITVKYINGPMNIVKIYDKTGKETGDSNAEYDMGTQTVAQKKTADGAVQNTITPIGGAPQPAPAPTTEGKRSFLDYLALEEGKQKGVDGKACWDGYKRMGTKKKGGKTVDNCVPTGKK